MSRTKLLLEVVQDIQALGNSFNIAINRARLPSTTTDS